jgi:hypothetical protein
MRPLPVLLAAGAFAGALAATACSHHGVATTTGTSSTTVTGTGGAGTGTGGTAGAGGCMEAWTCTPWETDGTSDAGPDTGTRTCTDQNACGTTMSKPLESGMLPALDVGYFTCNVMPILAAKCSMLGCHGTEQGRALRIYARARKRLAGQLLTNPACGGTASTPSDGCDGADSCLCVGPLTDTEQRKNYDAARGFDLDSLGKPLLSTKLAKSDLVAQPVVGGKDHGGIHLFNKTDADYATILSWLGGSKLAAPCP